MMRPQRCHQVRLEWRKWTSRCHWKIVRKAMVNPAPTMALPKAKKRSCVLGFKFVKQFLFVFLVSSSHVVDMRPINNHRGADGS